MRIISKIILNFYFFRHFFQVLQKKNSNKFFLRSIKQNKEQIACVQFLKIVFAAYNLIELTVSQGYYRILNYNCSSDFKIRAL